MTLTETFFNNNHYETIIVLDHKMSKSKEI